MLKYSKSFISISASTDVVLISCVAFSLFLVLWRITLKYCPARGPSLQISKCDVSQQITTVDGRYMLDIVVGKHVEFII